MQQAVPLPRQERRHGTPPSCTITAMNNLSTRAIQGQWPIARHDRGDVVREVRTIFAASAPMGRRLPE